MPPSTCRVPTAARRIWPDDTTATWILASNEDGTGLNQGEWQPSMSELLVPFPGGKALPAGDYHLNLRLDGDVLADYTFAVSDEAVTVTAISLAMSPDGPELTRLPDNVQHFYVRYTYQGACLGTPYWLVPP